jgi:predicted transcriptional regulator
VTELDRDKSGYLVRIEANQPARLASLVLMVQRERNKLSLADVAKRLGAASRNSYARYEQGTSVPTMAKFEELLAVVAPDLALSIAPRESKR